MGKEKCSNAYEGIAALGGFGSEKHLLMISQMEWAADVVLVWVAEGVRVLTHNVAYEIYAFCIPHVLAPRFGLSSSCRYRFLKLPV